MSRLVGTTQVAGSRAGKTLKVEFVSTSSPNTKKTFLVTLSAAHKNYTFNLTGFGTVGMINPNGSAEMYWRMHAAVNNSKVPVGGLRKNGKGSAHLRKA